jgi:hypothetical protein
MLIADLEQAPAQILDGDTISHCGLTKNSNKYTNGTCNRYNAVKTNNIDIFWFRQENTPLLLALLQK